MKNHKKYEELIQGYLDDNLSDKEKNELKEHLKTCKICKGRLKGRNNLLETLRSTKEEIECPDYLIGKILKNTTQKEPEPIIIRWRYLAVSAAAVLIIITTVMFNLEENRQILTTGEIKEAYKKGASKEIKIQKSIDTFSDKKKEYIAKDERPLARPTSEVAKTKTTKAPEAELPYIKKDFARVEKPEEAPSGEVVKAPLMPKTEISKGGEPLAPHFEPEKVAFSASRMTMEEESSLEDYSEETFFVFPEEGSVVGENFEIVLILEKPAEKIEIRLDGEEITHYTKSKDSNVIYIGSDSLPQLEEGFHYLSIKTPKEKGITFYKEG
jgi:hypothetical protein